MRQDVLPLNQIQDLDSVAASLSALLAMESNSDIRQEFPGSVGKYAGDAAGLARNLATLKDRFEEGECEDFVIFVGETAVGMSQVAKPLRAVYNVDPSSPMLSGYICNRDDGRGYRGQGLGRLSMQRRLRSVDDHFDGEAWTIVKTANIISRGLVLSSGFVLTGHSGQADTFTYSNQRCA